MPHTLPRSHGRLRTVSRIALAIGTLALAHGVAAQEAEEQARRSADGIIDYSNDDAAAFMPSLTWQPDENTSLTFLASWQKNDTSPYIQFLSLYGTLWSAEDFADGDFLPGDVFVGEPSFNYYDGERRAVSLVGEHAFDAVWGIGGSLRYTESRLDYAQMWWAYDDFGSALQSRRDDRSRGARSPTTIRAR